VAEPTLETDDEQISHISDLSMLALTG